MNLKKIKDSVIHYRAEIPAVLMKARTDIHLTHLENRDKTLPTHIILQDFYEGILPLIDKLVETQKGIDDSFILPSVEPSTIIEEPISYFNYLLSFTQENRNTIIESFVQNQIDEVQTLIAQTLYKLKNTK